MWRSYVGQTSQNFKQSYQEHDSYITLSACAGYILNNVHEHRPVGSMLLLTQVNRVRFPFVITLAQFYIQFFSNLCMTERNPLYLHWSAVCPTVWTVLLCWLPLSVQAGMCCIGGYSCCSVLQFYVCFVHLHILNVYSCSYINFFLTSVCSISRCDTLIHIFYKEMSYVLYMSTWRIFYSCTVTKHNFVTVHE
jgi:hypothetical protein